jgi:hypothetical protein
MERTDILGLMGELKLFGMRSAYDEVMAAGIKRQHEPPRIVGGLLKAEIAEKHARSIKYQMTIAKLPLAKDIDGFAFDSTPINEALVRDLSNGAFLPSSAKPCSSAGPAPAKRIWRSPSRGPASAAAPGAGSIMSSIWSTGWRVRRGLAATHGRLPVPSRLCRAG